MHSVTLYFLGAGRPLYLEAGDYDHACAQLFQAIGGLASVTRATVEQWARDIDARRAGMPNYSGMSCEHGALGLSWRYGRQDAEFARRMADIPAYPGLSYADCVSNRPAAERAA